MTIISLGAVRTISVVMKTRFLLTVPILLLGNDLPSLHEYVPWLSASSCTTVKKLQGGEATKERENKKQ